MLPVSVTLTPDGEGLMASFDFDGQFTADGSATKASN